MTKASYLLYMPFKNGNIAEYQYTVKCHPAD